MAMNREQKRALQRSGDVGEDGEPVRKRPAKGRQQPTPRTKSERTAPRQFLREVTAELRKVA